MNHSSDHGPGHREVSLANLSLDWIDLVGVMITFYAFFAAYTLLERAGFRLAILQWSAIVVGVAAFPLARRRWMQAPTRAVTHAVSTKGVVATLLMYLGVVFGLMGIFGLKLSTESPETAEMRDWPADVRAREIARREDDKRSSLYMGLAMGLVGPALVFAGGMLERKRSHQS